MSCLTDGVLRTFLDRELPSGEFAAAERHIRNCAACGARLSAIQAQTASVHENLAVLEQDLSATDSRLAYQRFQKASAGRTGSMRRWSRPALGWVAAAVIVLLVLGFSPGRTWAQRVLEMLRVQKIAVLPVDLSALTVQNGFGQGGLIPRFMSDNVVVTMKPGPAEVATDAASASQMAGYTVRTLDQLGTPQKIFVHNEGAFQMTLNRDRLQALVDEVGRSDVQIPDSVDGSLVAVHVPKMVFLQYGSCGQKTNTVSQSCINFTQVPGPTVSVPPSLNIAALAEAVLQLTGMSAADAQAFAQTVDWSSTLIIPVPRAGGSFRTVPVDGVNGTLIEAMSEGKSAGHYQLIWVKNGIVYSLEGEGTSSQALAAAASLS